MGGISTEGGRNPGRLRRSLLLGAGVALFAAGAIILSIGLIGYFGRGGSSEPLESTSDLIPDYLRPEDVENLPVAIPYYDPQREAPERQPEPALSAPLRLVIEAIGVDAPVVEMGMDADGVPYVPLNENDVAWYNFSSPPGAGSNAVFAGHVAWFSPHAVFEDLADLQQGDIVRLAFDDGDELVYEVFANFPVDPNDKESLKVMAPTPTDTVTLITCGGAWLPDPSHQFGGEYTNRTIVQARLVDSSPPTSAAGGG